MLLTTQYLDEADRLAERIAVIDRGLLIADGTPDELKSGCGGDRLEVHLADAAQGEPAIAALSALANGSPSLTNGTVRIPIQTRTGAIAEAVRRLDAAGVGIDDLAVRTPTLDDVFLQLTGHTAEAEEEEVEEAASR